MGTMRANPPLGAERAQVEELQARATPISVGDRDLLTGTRIINLRRGGARLLRALRPPLRRSANLTVLP